MTLMFLQYTSRLQIKTNFAIQNTLSQSLYRNQFRMYTRPIHYTQHINPKKVELLNLQAREKFLSKLRSSYQENYLNFHPYGLVFFNKDIMNRKNLELFDYLVLAMFQNPEWEVGVKTKQQKQHWDERLALIQQAQIKKLSYKGILNTNLLRTIERISFSVLTELSLFACGIDNLEGLSIIDAPNLKKINLIYNKAVQYKSLKKSNFKLQSLQIYSMDATQSSQQIVSCVKIDHFQRWNFPLIDLRMQKHVYNSIIMNDISFLAKMKSSKNNQLYSFISLDRRVRQQPVQQKLYRQKNIFFNVFRPLVNMNTQQTEMIQMMLHY